MNSPGSISSHASEPSWTKLYIKKPFKFIEAHFVDEVAHLLYCSDLTRRQVNTLASHIFAVCSQSQPSEEKKITIRDIREKVVEIEKSEPDLSPFFFTAIVNNYKNIESNEKPILMLSLSKLYLKRSIHERKIHPQLFFNELLSPTTPPEIRIQAYQIKSAFASVEESLKCYEKIYKVARFNKLPEAPGDYCFDVINSKVTWEKMGNMMYANFLSIYGIAMCSISRPDAKRVLKQTRKHMRVDTEILFHGKELLNTFSTGNSYVDDMLSFQKIITRTLEIDFPYHQNLIIELLATAYPCSLERIFPPLTARQQENLGSLCIEGGHIMTLGEKKYPQDKEGVVKLQIGAKSAVLRTDGVGKALWFYHQVPKGSSAYGEALHNIIMNTYYTTLDQTGSRRNAYKSVKTDLEKVAITLSHIASSPNKEQQASCEFLDRVQRCAYEWTMHADREKEEKTLQVVVKAMRMIEGGDVDVPSAECERKSVKRRVLM